MDPADPDLHPNKKFMDPQTLLLVQAGETVLVVSREESDWWRGEVDGRTGVFPSNYVQPAPCEYGSSGDNGGRGFSYQCCGSGSGIRDG
jgi:hypothetical protein